MYRAKARAAGCSDEDTERGDMIRYYDPPFQRFTVDFEESDTVPD